MKKVTIVLMGAVIVSLASGEEQQKASQRYTPLGTILGGEGVVYEEGKQRVIIYATFLEKKRFYEGGDETGDPKSTTADRKGVLKQYSATYRRGFGDGWDGRVFLPYFVKSQELNHPDKLRREQENSGIGDVFLIARKELLSQKNGDPLFLALGAGVKLPTGSSNKEFVKYYPATQGGVYAIKQSMEMQNGSGSTDPFLELGLTKMYPNSRVDALISYQYTTKGKGGYEFGDTLKYSAAYTYMLHPIFDVEAGFLGNIAQKDMYGGEELNNKGGHTVFGELGVHIKLHRQLDISAGYLIPVYKNVNGGSGGSGKDAYPSGQGVEDNRVMVRVGINF